MIFDYPDPSDNRKHGPIGYTEYSRYRPWLRDEFKFRCAYCLERELWSTNSMHIDHLVPVSKNKSLTCTYENLVYSCERCNLTKLDEEVGDPFYVMVSTQVQVDYESGEIEGCTNEAQLIIDVLDLNGPRVVSRRKRLIQTKPEELWFCFPDDLPPLTNLKPRDNCRPEGKQETWYAKRKAGTLPKTY